MKKGVGAILVAAAASALLTQPASAHKPVTSKYTYTDDVYPIVSRECGGCHVPGGIAPMSLLTYDDARPWAESIRQELASGHMPPWFGDAGFAGLRDPHRLSPRDLDVVLTWVSGGTPRGPVNPSEPVKTPALKSAWRRGRPAMTLQMPAAVSLPAGTPEDTEEFVLASGRDRDRIVSVADLLPGNPAIVHDAVVFVRGAEGTHDRVIAAWVPGATPASAGPGIGFPWRMGEQLGVRIHYKKNWKLENKAASDRSAVGLYFVNGPAREVRPLDLDATNAVLDADAQALAVLVTRDKGQAGDVGVRIEATRPDGSRVPVAGFGTRRGWDQRYWLARPLALPKGTRLEITTTDPSTSAVHVSLDLVRPPA